MNKMNNVPDDIITGKDLDYLSDIFQWNYIALKKTCSDMQEITDQSISDLFEEASNLFDSNLNDVLSIISNPGGELDE